MLFFWQDSAWLHELEPAGSEPSQLESSDSDPFTDFVQVDELDAPAFKIAGASVPLKVAQASASDDKAKGAVTQ